MSEPKTWGDAQTICRALGGYLAEIKTEDQNLLVEGIMFEHPGRDIWLGGNDLVSEGKWYWATSDTEVSSSGFTYWGPNEPSNGGSLTAENCMEFKEVNRRWNDVNCEYKLPFICQKPTESIVVG